MARKPNTTGGTKAPAKTAAAAKTEAPKSARSPSRRAKEPAEETITGKAGGAARAAVETVTEPVKAAASKTKKAASAAKGRAAKLVDDIPAPSAPSFPTGEIAAFAKTIGTQALGALNTDVGRVMVAELLVHVAKSLTTAAASTEAGKDAKEGLLNAGAKIGAAVATAGAKIVESGGAAASTGAEAATGAAGNAKDLAREVVSVAASAVGGVVAQAAKKAVRRNLGGSEQANSGPATPTGPNRIL